jgi:two-component system, NarL family, invasion response regulator UvrY
MMSGKVVIVDDHELVRTGITQSLESTDDLTVIGAYPDGEKLLAALEGGLVCDIVLLDLSLAEGTGLNVLSVLRQKFASVPVLVLSGHAEAQFGVNVLRAGAAGFVSKGASEPELLRAIRQVIQGKKYVSANLADLLIEDRKSDSGGPQHAILSQREFQIFLSLAEGVSATEIAQKLKLSVKTVSTYRTRILEKMHMRTNADIVKYALTNELRTG